MRTSDILKGLKDNAIVVNCDPKWTNKFEEFLAVQQYEYEIQADAGKISYKIFNASDEVKEVIEDWFEMAEQYPLSESVIEEVRVAAITVVKSWGANDIQDYAISIVQANVGGVDAIEVISTLLDFDAMETLCGVLSDVVKHYGYAVFEPESCSLWRAKKYAS